MTPYTPVPFWGLAGITWPMGAAGINGGYWELAGINPGLMGFAGT